jgi:hypothetical protein
MLRAGTPAVRWDAMLRAAAGCREQAAFSAGLATGAAFNPWARWLVCVLLARPAAAPWRVVRQWTFATRVWLLCTVREAKHQQTPWVPGMHVGGGVFVPAAPSLR